MFTTLRQHGAAVFRWLGALVCLGSAVGLSLSLVSCAGLERTVMEPPVIPGATFVGNGACADCHSNYTRVFAGSPHARVHLPGVKGEGGCESCHGPGSKHVANPQGLDKFIVNPRKDAGTCFQCHLQQHAEFNLPQHHPVTEGKMNCVNCHDPHGFQIFKRAGGLAFARGNETCAECHREQSRPVIYEHEVMRQGCTVCHNPHGSVNAKMLVQRDNNLCLKCHAQLQGTGIVKGGGLYIGKVDHSQLMRQGSCWSAGCHTAIHGSNVSPKMFY